MDGPGAPTSAMTAGPERGADSGVRPFLRRAGAETKYSREYGRAIMSECLTPSSRLLFAATESAR